MNIQHSHFTQIEYNISFLSFACARFLIDLLFVLWGKNSSCGIFSFFSYSMSYFEPISINGTRKFYSRVLYNIFFLQPLHEFLYWKKVNKKFTIENKTSKRSIYHTSFLSFWHNKLLKNGVWKRTIENIY